MITSNPILGTGLHAVGGISAANCYLPNTQTKKWSWGTFWLVQALFAWIIMPLGWGVLMKEWKSVKPKTNIVLIIGLLILIASFCITGYGSYFGERVINNLP